MSVLGGNRGWGFLSWKGIEDGDICPGRVQGMGMSVPGGNRGWECLS